MAKVTWIGDSDPAAQVVSAFGHTFVKGEPVDVTDETALRKIGSNPTFSLEKVEPVAADEPEAPDPEAGTEKAAIKAKLAEHGVTVKGNPSLDTLRGRLAKAVAGEAHDD